jgi:hypothetical protein
MSITIVTLSAFSNLAGAALAQDIRHLLTNPVYTHLVLFSDVAGEQLAILPVGPGQEYTQLSALQGKEIEGLRPLCALRTQVEALPSADVPAKVSRTDEEAAQFAAREKELARKEETLRAREEYLAECEQRMAQVGQNLAEREAMVDQREAMIIEKEREFFRRGGEVVGKPSARDAKANEA